MRSVTTTLDATFVAGLLGVAAVILLPLRGSALFENPLFAIGLVVVLPALVTAAWVRRAGPVMTPVAGSDDALHESRSWRNESPGP